MLGLSRFAGPGAAQTEDLGSLPASEQSLMSSHARYQPLPTGDDVNQGEVGSGKCLCTRSGPFNLLVGLVVCANAVFIGLEADLGLLGPTGPHWSGFEKDLRAVGVDGLGPNEIESELSQGIQADAAVKAKVQNALNSSLPKSINIQSDLELPAGAEQLRPAAYTLCEYGFVLFYLFEMLVRLCDLGCRDYCGSPWMPLDVGVCSTGVADLVLPFFLEGNGERLWLLPLFRVLRVLRLLKLFQVSQGLRIIGRSFMKAFSVVVLVGLVVLILDFGLAVILTSLVGQRAFLWAGEDRISIDAWFGSVGKTMQTLFSIQTLSGWDHIAAILGEVMPLSVLVPCLVLYMMLCCFAVIGLITSVIGDSFAAAQRRESKLCELGMQLRRCETTRAFAHLFASYARSNPSSISKPEFEAALSAAPVEKMLQQVDVVTSNQDLLRLYDELGQDPAFANNIKVEHLAEAATNLTGSAQAFSIFELKRSIQGMRFEIAARGDAAAKHAETHQESHKTTRQVVGQVGDVQKEMASIRQDITSLSLQVSAVMAKCEAQEQEKRDHGEAMSTINKKLAALSDQFAAQSATGLKIDAIASQLAVQSTMNGKVDALTVQLATQAMATAKIEALMEQVSAQLIGLHTSSSDKVQQMLQVEEPSLPAELRTSEPAAEPESSAMFSEFDILEANRQQHLLQAASEPAQPPSTQNVDNGATASSAAEQVAANAEDKDEDSAQAEAESAALIAELSKAAAAREHQMPLETLPEVQLSSTPSAAPEPASSAFLEMAGEPWAAAFDNAVQQQPQLQESWASFPDATGLGAPGSVPQSGSGAEPEQEAAADAPTGPTDLFKAFEGLEGTVPNSGAGSSS